MEINIYSDYNGLKRTNKTGYNMRMIVERDNTITYMMIVIIGCICASVIGVSYARVIDKRKKSDK
jgi:dolichol kinase